MARTSIRFSGLSSTWRILARLPSLRTGAGMPSSSGLVGRRGERQCEVEGRSLALATLRPDASPVQLDEPLADGQSEPGAVGLLCERVVEPLQGLEQPRQVAARNA